MRRSLLTILSSMAVVALFSLSCSESSDEPTPVPTPGDKEDSAVVKVLYWNLQCGMWADQGNNYDNFVAWVKAQNPDICVWNEAETTFDTGVFDWNTQAKEKYLPEHWPELAARYGHEYVMVNGASKGLVTTSRIPFERECDIYCNRPKVEIRSGSTIYKFSIGGETVRFVTLHLWPHHYDPYVAVGEREQSKKQNGGDFFRLAEIRTLCDTTVNKRPEAALENWIMLGDFNARSPLDNEVYKYSPDAPALKCISYIHNNTPYIDIVHERHPNEFITSTYDWNHRIDYVFCTPHVNKRVVKADIVKDYYTNIRPLDELYPGQYARTPSDHYPIIFTLDINK